MALDLALDLYEAGKHAKTRALTRPDLDTAQESACRVLDSEIPAERVVPPRGERMDDRALGGSGGWSAD